MRGRRVLLRPVRPEDIDRLREILAEPSVARWWGLPGVGDPTDDWLLGTDTVAFAIEVDGSVMGAIQYAEETDPDYRHAGIDLFLATSYQGQGLGTDAIRTLARHLIEGRGHHRLTIDPAADNERAIRAYAAVGFTPVGVMRAYERGPDGTFHDGLLMELLRGELR
ncbi:MAG: GNAT family N-acetyltransferase [Candidatus Limnocylindrales bacterium]